MPVVLEGSEPGLSFSLYADKKLEKPVVRCPDRCLVYVPPQKYWLSVSEGSETLAGRRQVNVDGPSRLVVEPRSKSDRSTGLAMGIGGIALVVVGSVAMLAGAIQSIDNVDNPDNHSNDGGNLVALGLAGFVAGAILTPIGWVQFGRSAPGVQTEALGPSRTH